MTHKKPFIPNENNNTADSTWNWYNNIIEELNVINLSPKEKVYICNYYTEAGLLTKWRKQFFKKHYSNTLYETTKFLTKDLQQKQPTLLDLGCGIGTQSLYFAFCGYKVISVDLDETALKIFKKRIKYYENLTKKKFNIEIYCSNTFEFDYSKHMPIDAIYSLFAFNMMQPNKDLISKIFKCISVNAKFIIQDGNNLSWLARLLPSRKRNVLSPLDMQNELKSYGFSIKAHTGGVSLPPIFWYIFPYSLLKKIDSFLNKFWIFPVSHHILAEKGF